MMGAEQNKLLDVELVLNMVKDHLEFGTDITDCPMCKTWVPWAQGRLQEVLDA